MKKVDFDYLCKLANLDLSEEEKIKIEPQLREIVAWVDKLGELKVEDKEERAFGIESSLPLRKDKPEKSIPLPEVLSMSPECNQNFIKVPKVIETK